MNSFRLSTARIAMLTFLACAVTTQTFADETQRPVVIPLSTYLGVVPALTLQVDGRDALFLLDTAGGVSVVTPAFATAVHCTPWGRITGYRMRGDRLDLGRCDNLHLSVSGTKLQIPTAGVWDLAAMLPKDAPSLQGSLALDAFAGRAITLDLAAHKLIIETPASLKIRVRDATEIAARFSREIQGLALTALIAVDTSMGRLWMELDSGSDGAIIVAKHAAKALALDADKHTAQPVTLPLGAAMKLSGPALVQDLILDGNIGNRVLANWVVTMDLANQRLWIAEKIMH